MTKRKTPTQELKDSGTRRAFASGSVRDAAEGKGRYDLLPCGAIRRLALHYERGAKKYAARNWEKGQPFSVLFDSALRHAFKALDGQTDEDHLAAAVWNLCAVMEFEERGRAAELNDLKGGGK